MNYFSYVQLNSFRSPATAADGPAGVSQRPTAYHHPMQLPRNYGFWNGPRAIYTPRSIAEESSPRRGWMPSRCLMLVLFVVGVSVCVSSGFALFVEYQKSCPPPENSASEDNSEEMSSEQLSVVPADQEASPSSCASANSSPAALQDLYPTSISSSIHIGRARTIRYDIPAERLLSH